MKATSLGACALAIALGALVATSAEAGVAMRWFPHFSRSLHRDAHERSAENTREGERRRNEASRDDVELLAAPAVEPDESQPAPTPVDTEPDVLLPAYPLYVPSPIDEAPRHAGPHIIEIGGAASKPASRPLPRIIYGDTPPESSNGPRIIYGSAPLASRGPKIIYGDTP